MSEPRDPEREPPRRAETPADDVTFSSAPAEEVGARVGGSVSGAPQGRERVSQPRLIAARESGRALVSWPTRWALSTAAVVSLAVLVVVWSGLRVTAEDHAKPLLARALVPLTEIDALLETEYAGLIADARESGRALPLPHYPLGVTVPAAELATMSREELRARVLEESAAELYANGLGEFRRQPGAENGGLFSPRGVARWTIGRLTSSTHDVFWGVLAGALILAAPPLILAIALSHPSERLRNVAAILAATGTLLVVATVAARFALRVTADGADDPFNAALLRIGADALSVVLRNGLILLVLGVGTAALWLGTGPAEGWWRSVWGGAQRPGAVH